MRNAPGSGAVMLAGLWLLFTVLSAVGRFASSIDEPSRPALGQVAFWLTLALPFLVAFGALRLRHPGQQAAIWIACGLLIFAVSAVLTLFGVVLFLPACVLLLVAGCAAYRARGAYPRWLVASIALTLTVAGVVSSFALFATEDARCWAHVLHADGSTTWEARPCEFDGDAVGMQSSARYNSDGSLAPGEFGGYTDGDVVTNREGARSLVAWALGLGLAYSALRFWQPRDTDAASTRPAPSAPSPTTATPA
jgi:hypothetical protein